MLMSEVSSPQIMALSSYHRSYIAHAQALWQDYVCFIVAAEVDGTWKIFIRIIATHVVTCDSDIDNIGKGPAYYSNNNNNNYNNNNNNYYYYYCCCFTLWPVVVQKDHFAYNNLFITQNKGERQILSWYMRT